MSDMPKWSDYNFTVVDTGLRFRGHPILLGSDTLHRSADKCVLTQLDRFLRKNLSKQLIETLVNHSTGILVKGAIPPKSQRKGVSDGTV